MPWVPLTPRYIYHADETTDCVVYHQGAPTTIPGMPTTHHGSSIEIQHSTEQRIKITVLFISRELVRLYFSENLIPKLLSFLKGSHLSCPTHCRSWQLRLQFLMPLSIFGNLSRYTLKGPCRSNLIYTLDWWQIIGKVSKLCSSPTLTANRPPWHF